MADYRVMGIASERSIVEQVVQELQNGGFEQSTISVMYLQPEELADQGEQTQVAKGAVAGGATGGALGALLGAAALAIPGVGPVISAGIFGAAAAGAASGGVLGAFSQIGLADDLAASYQESLEQGDTIFAIDTPNPDRAADAEHILRDNTFSLVNTFQV